MVDVVTLKAANGKRWANARMTRDFSAAAKRLVAAKTRYQAVEARTGVPWSIIAVIHERESSQNWSRSLAQGDPWDRVSIHVPAGRGPFESWEDAAIDALVNCAPHAARNKDWSIAAALTKLEEYNGLGYAARGKPSPYVWAGTNQYQSGKYVRDGVYDPNAVDRQPGCAGLLTAMMRLDPSIQFGAGVAPGASASKATSAPKSLGKPSSTSPSVRNPSSGSIGALIKSLLGAIVGGK